MAPLSEAVRILSLLPPGWRGIETPVHWRNSTNLAAGTKCRGPLHDLPPRHHRENSAGSSGNPRTISGTSACRPQCEGMGLRSLPSRERPRDGGGRRGQRHACLGTAVAPCQVYSSILRFVPPWRTPGSPATRPWPGTLVPPEL